MSAKDILRSNENAALNNNQIISTVVGRKAKNTKGLKKGFGAAAFITAMIIVFAVLFGSGNLIPSAISERLIEETDVQYADAVESKALVFEQALLDGNVPDNTAKKLKDSGVLVGYLKDGEFVEANSVSGSLSLKIKDQIVSANDFVRELNNNAVLYNAFNTATYSRAAYYYDKSAQKVFRKLGISRNNFSGDKSFEEVMTKVVGEGSNIDVNSVGLYEKKDEQSGKTYFEYGTVGNNSSSDSSADAFVEGVRAKSINTSKEQATMDAASNINVADTISKEQKSSLFFATFMENISKMKAGYGGESKINEAMNYLYKSEETEVVDVETGEIVKVTGSMLESHSLYSVLSGEKVNIQKVENYSSDRVIKTVENQLGASSSNGALKNTVASTSRGIKGSIGRLINFGESAIGEIISKVTPTVKSSLIDNSFDDIKGVRGGELLVEGAVNVGKELAKASGATAGDATSVKSYAKLNNTILALEAKADRLNRSPFDITSKNTFLGSILHNLAVSSAKSTSIMSGLSSFSVVITKSVADLLPVTYADDENNSFLTNFGDCETLGNIGAVGSASCAMIATFDTSTINDIYNDPEFVSFVEKNTTLSNGVRTINNNSTLAKFIIYNNERVTPVGVVDGGILESTSNESVSLPFVSNILGMVKNFLGANEQSKRLASGEAFLNSSLNSDWNTYKYAQRYVSLARAQEALRQYDGDKTAYNIRFFEGDENPVIAFLESYYSIANK